MTAAIATIRKGPNTVRAVAYRLKSPSPWWPGDIAVP